ncbi:hypothetical protein LR48_Vigan511s001400 [Vigna angularis]|uniref:Uncharacterized protein n=1 Tax=Phaseolus angularis TaxID=3914 RepID=A0A0L9TCT0_PHAAN|nr:hypothetical protein LR48_Vigan511s001400 [Vigna angularis]
MYEKGVKYKEVRGEARQGVGMMNLLSSVPTQTTRKPFGTMSALLGAEEDEVSPLTSGRLSHNSEPLNGGASLTGTNRIQEHYGRVRDLRLGPCLSKVFGVKARSHSGSSSVAPSNNELQTQVSSLTSQVNDMTSQVNEMKEMIAIMLQIYQGQLPSKFASFQ